MSPRDDVVPPYTDESANLSSIFAIQLAEERPDAKITGLDISSEQYPPAWTVPANVSFDLWNFFDSVPDKYVGRFDVVHVRLIVGAMIKKDKDPVVKNLVKLLSKSNPSPQSKQTRDSANYA
jgi:hypothetical protein